MMQFLTSSFQSLATQTGPTFWLPEAVSNFAPTVDGDFYFVYWVSIFFLVLITALLILFMWKYSAPEGQKATSQNDHNLVLEIAWTGIPVILSLMMFWYGYKGYVAMATPPANAMVITAEAAKWSWNFSYPASGTVVSGASEDFNEIRNALRSGELTAEQAAEREAKVLEKAGLHVPVNTPVQVNVLAADVLHSLFIPAFRVKKDCVPGRIGQLGFEATEPGVYSLYCSEYCGQGHSAMHSKVVVHPSQEDFDKWLAVAASYDETLPFTELGEIVWKRKGCVSCHSLDGAMKTGPTWKGLFGSERKYTENGTLGSAIADESYIEESIRYPMKKISDGYTGQMPVVKLTDKEILWVTEFIKSLRQ